MQAIEGYATTDRGQWDPLHFYFPPPGANGLTWKYKKTLTRGTSTKTTLNEWQ
jgi:hypothetical protein